MSRRVGVLGTFVWDTIRYAPDARRPDLEQWGGLAYSLAAWSAVSPEGWRVELLAKVGSDLAGSARAFVEALAGPLAAGALREVDEPNNRVELRYTDAAERTERLTGGVAPWTLGELEPIVAGLDALYVNFISGYEMELATARALRSLVRGPIYADLHSLFLGPVGPGPRPRRRLREWSAWIDCFDFIQLNEVELTLAGEPGGDPIERVAEAPRLRAAFVTRGGAGATIVVPAANTAEPGIGPGAHDVPAVGGARPGDPTGCGDVWGSVACASILDGAPLRGAAERAHAAAVAKLSIDRIEALRSAIARAVGGGSPPGEPGRLP